MTDFIDEYRQYQKEFGEPSRIELMLCDINGILRGKWLPGDQVEKLENGAVRLPLSTYAANILGAEVPETGLGGIIGDPDGAVEPIAGTLKPVPWVDGNVAQVLVELKDGDKISDLSSRKILSETLKKSTSQDLHLVMATELEFYVVKKRAHASQAPERPDCIPPNQNYDLEVLSEFENLLSEILSASAAQGLATDTLIAEYGPGQFEINFHHTDDILHAADTALLFRRVVRGVTAKHGFEATFMAKPYAHETGNGMHVHASVLNNNGDNIFDAPDGVSKNLGHAVAGVLDTMPDLQALFAPHLNSYRRFQASSFSPNRPDWGLDHRGAAIRVPETSGKGARLEHRISGADVNPYLVLAAIVGGMVHGLNAKLAPPPPLDDPKATPAIPLNHDWATALTQFENSDFARKLLGEAYHRIYVIIRRYEIETLTAEITPTEYRTYLSRL